MKIVDCGTHLRQRHCWLVPGLLAVLGVWFWWLSPWEVLGKCRLLYHLSPRNAPSLGNRPDSQRLTAADSRAEPVSVCLGFQGSGSSPVCCLWGRRSDWVCVFSPRPRSVLVCFPPFPHVVCHRCCLPSSCYRFPDCHRLLGCWHPSQNLSPTDHSDFDRLPSLAPSLSLVFSPVLICHFRKHFPPWWILNWQVPGCVTYLQPIQRALWLA